MWRSLSAYSTSYYTLVLCAVGICAILRWSGSITVGFCYLWVFRFFGVGAHIQGIPLGCWNLVCKCFIGGVPANARSAMVWKTTCELCHIWRWCPVLSSDVPVVFQLCSCASRCSCIVPALLYVMYCDIIVWQMCLYLKFTWIMLTLC